jgi:putative endonuclease
VCREITACALNAFTGLHPRQCAERQLYIGMTNDLGRRMYEHREGLVAGFTKRCVIKTLVYFESFPTAADAIQREARLKKYPRAWKINLILANNPGWRDLAEGLNG